MHFPFKTLLPIVTALALNGCGAPVKQVDYAPSPDIAPYEHAAPIKFSGLELILPPGMNVGAQRSGMFCQVSGAPVNRTIFQKEIDHTFLRQTFHDALEANGYDVVSSLDIAFDEDDEEQRAEYGVKAKIKDAQIDMCESAPGALDFWARTPGQYGRLYLAIDWSVYDYLKRTVVYKIRTEGFTERNIPNQEGLALMFQDAFEMAAHNLAADQDFENLIFHGQKPDTRAAALDTDAKADHRPRQFSANEPVALKPLPLSRQPFAKDADRMRKAAVTIQKIGHGSGVFITQDGHILTNAHVVGDARQMRIITADKRATLTAEVLRVDKLRDVALLKLTEIPAGMDITTLPVRLDWPRVGEDVYAIGTPRDFKLLHDTLTKGIISAHRKNFKIDGIRENYIQADVQVHAGNSGGPLLDEYGNLVGLSMAGLYTETEYTGNGLNLFIPIEEALSRLDISYQ